MTAYLVTCYELYDGFHIEAAGMSYALAEATSRVNRWLDSHGVGPARDVQAVGFRDDDGFYEICVGVQSIVGISADDVLEALDRAMELMDSRAGGTFPEGSHNVIRHAESAQEVVG